VFYRTRVYPMH